MYKQMQELPTGSKDEARSMLRASIHLIKRSIDDNVYAVGTFSSVRVPVVML